ncbi:4648_t:CDS:1, partial [Entrophospora sp. SA101]
PLELFEFLLVGSWALKEVQKYEKKGSGKCIPKKILRGGNCSQMY